MEEYGTTRIYAICDRCYGIYHIDVDTKDLEKFEGTDISAKEAFGNYITDGQLHLLETCICENCATKKFKPLSEPLGVLLVAKEDHPPFVTKGTVYEVFDIDEYFDGCKTYWYYDDNLVPDYITSTTNWFDIYYQF